MSSSLDAFFIYKTSHQASYAKSATVLPKHGTILQNLWKSMFVVSLKTRLRSITTTSFPKLKAYIFKKLKKSKV
jgi:hypothetical protein